jgi:uncharacterized protein YdbL (DUF1318 family)
MTTFYHTIAIALCLMVGMISVSFAADRLSDAKSAGLVGERLDGYLGTVSSNPPADVLDLVQGINRKRKQAYQEIAIQQGQPLHVVEKLMVEKLIQRAESGHYIMGEDGRWIRKH